MKAQEDTSVMLEMFLHWIPQDLLVHHNVIILKGRANKWTIIIAWSWVEQVKCTNSFEHIKCFYFEVVPSPTNLEKNQKNQNANEICHLI